MAGRLDAVDRVVFRAAIPWVHSWRASSVRRLRGSRRRSSLCSSFVKCMSIGAPRLIVAMVVPKQGRQSMWLLLPCPGSYSLIIA